MVCFYAWAKDYNPSVYIVQKDGSHYSFRKGFWNTLNSDLFVLGDSNHRYELLGDASNLTSNLMISKNDWENFDKHLIAEKTESLIPELPLHHANSKFTLRQRRYGEHSKNSPHFKLMVEKPEIGNRYISREIDRTGSKSSQSRLKIS